ncbi:SLC13 family permease [Nocardioides sp. 1609]|uniref:SLC13 family permease n=1 Tax=Nocardioides sp. 1609 TaxID=2508327 RepID=UPI001430F043|nr:SLC13 family permease [Nocardioides sp. 1609]
MWTDVVGGVVLGLVFLLGSVTRLNLGALGLIASYVVGGLLLGETPEELLAGFPITLFVLFLGVTYLFSVAAANGTMNWIVSRATQLIYGRAALLPAGLFVASAAMSSIGVPAPAAVAMLGTVGIRLGLQYGQPIFVSALVVILGACAGTFSPISLISITSLESVRNADLEVQPVVFYVVCVTVFALLALVVTMVAELVRARAGSQAIPVHAGAVHVGASGLDGSVSDGGAEIDESAAEQDHAAPFDRAVLATLVGIGLVLAGAVILDADLGLLALGVALILHLLFPRDGATSDISWDIILMICGLVTYIGVLQRAGTIGRVGDALANFDEPILAALLLCVAAALISAFASSPATIGATVPLSIPLMTDAGLPVLGLTAAIALSSVIVDASPFSATGALAVAGAPEGSRPKLLNGLMVWGLSMIVVAPLLTVGLLIGVPSLF